MRLCGDAVTPSASLRSAPPFYIGLPQRFCEAKDLWEEETQVERSSRKERSGGPAGFAVTRRQGNRSYSLRLAIGIRRMMSHLPEEEAKKR